MLDGAAAIELTGLGARIEAHYGAPQDIEWARKDRRFFIVQSRPITALPEAEGPVPTDWTVPRRKTMYVRASIVEQLPDPLSPLFADLINGAVTRSIIRLFTEFLGRNVIHDGDLALPTINGYAYYSYSRAGMARIMLQAPKAMKVLVRSDQYGARPRWQHYSHPRYEAIVARWTGQSIHELTSAELIDGVVALLDAGGVLHVGANDYPARRDERSDLHLDLQRPGAKRAGSASPDISARVRQRTDSRRKVALRYGDRSQGAAVARDRPEGAELRFIGRTLAAR